MICAIRRHFPSATALAVLLALAGCPTSDDDGASEGSGSSDAGAGGGQGDGAGDDNPPPDVPAMSYCAVAEDCVAVSSACCECPTFAVARGSDFAGACDQVECEPLEDCSAVLPDCVDSQCQLVCETVPASMVCINGFARDSLGCLLDECRQPTDEIFACEQDGDCTQVQADCCGCERGGADTAVANGSVDEYIKSLGCPSQPPCPGVDVCDAELVPRCIAQTCTLGPADDGGDAGDGDGSGDGPGGGNLCGVPDYLPCPMGQVCVLNHPDAEDATRMGVGSCVSA